jgi:NAD(P)H-hydrate epimerase
LGKHAETRAALLELIDHCQTPMVIDADALNILGEERDYLYRLPSGSILTPHPGEMDRLVGRSESSYQRLQKARELAREAQVCIVLKGAYTAVIDTNGQCWFNSTGNPGMATGGSGDVLTGILTALLAQNYKSVDAARLGVYIHGFAGDLAAAKLGEISLTAHDIINYLPAAFSFRE